MSRSDRDRESVTSEYSPPIIFTSLEDWHNECDNGILTDSIRMKVHEIFGHSCKPEEAITLSYHIVEMMQMLEHRQPAYELVASRIKKKFDFNFMSGDVNKLLSDRKIFSSAVSMLKEKTTHSKKRLDSFIDYNLLGMHTPDPNSTKRSTLDYKKDYKRCYNEFIEENKHLF